MTLWIWQHVVCDERPYTRIFVAPRCSAAFCLYVISIAALILFPLFATFASDNMWLKEGSCRIQPAVSFSHDLLVAIAGKSPEQAVGWSSRSELEPLLPQQLRVPTVRSSSEDVNHDGIPERLKLVVEMPAVQKDQEYPGIQNVMLLAAYQVELSGKISEKLTGLIAIDSSSPYPASGVSLQGHLVFRQNNPLRQTSGAREVYSESPLAIDWKSNWIAKSPPLKIENILERYARRNETVHLELRVPAVWDYTPRDGFKLELAIEITPQLVHFVPGAAEVLKHGWVQYLAFLIPTWLLVDWIRGFAYDYQLVETYVVPQLPLPNKDKDL
eukprot:TRINITY_DN49140_c0_g1_i1.p1 TRINITY_DN49140_c0_g1~~TRINITY_DN49140_c0_g1_i1.p1  ORF type:complete len:328 (+),score=38.39 TRINITY_DN49140_c0_g1_i1:61-1044(+)